MSAVYNRSVVSGIAIILMQKTGEADGMERIETEGRWLCWAAIDNHIKAQRRENSLGGFPGKTI